MEKEWNRELCFLAMRQRDVESSYCVYCYVSLPHEAGTKELIESLLLLGKCVAVPKVEGDRLVFYAISGLRDLEKGRMGILEPKPSCIRVRDRTAPVIVPGLAFDREMHRIGYGGGYYDRFLEDEPQHPKIGLAFPFQMFERLPAESHDKSMNQVILPMTWHFPVSDTMNDV